jgi:hypothetical protein
MGNSAGKENDINNLMHVTIVKDADLPKTHVEENKASGDFSFHTCQTLKLKSQNIIGIIIYPHTRKASFGTE